MTPHVASFQADVLRALGRIGKQVARRIVATGKLKKSADAHLLEKGDEPGHEFRGNQYTSSEGEAPPPKVTRGKDFDYLGNYNVHYAGHDFTLSRNRDLGGLGEWTLDNSHLSLQERKDAGMHALHTTTDHGAFLGFNRKEALQTLVERVNAKDRLTLAYALRAKKLEKSAVDDAAHGAQTSPLNADPPYPTESRRRAGNYRKGHVRVGGLDISIENPAGSHRRPEWPALASHYGYVTRGTEGADGDAVDVFVRPGISEDYDGPVFVIDQLRQAGGGGIGGGAARDEFDEHKCMIGWRTAEAARAAYLDCYQTGWRCGPITELTLDEFKRWLRSGDTAKPLAKRADPAAYLLERYHITVVDRTGGAEPVARVLSAVAGELDRLAAAGAIVDEALRSKALMTLVLYPTDKITEGCYAGAMADYEQDEATLYLAAGLPLEVGPLRLGEGEHNVSVDLHGVVAHEIGHLVKPFVEQAIHLNVRSIYDQRKPDDWGSLVSGYARTDDHELFAEAFSAYTHPAYTGGLPRELDAVLTAAGVFPPVTKAKKPKGEPSQADVDALLDEVGGADWVLLEEVISPAIQAAFERGGMFELTTAKLDDVRELVSSVDEAAAAYAEEHGAELVTDLTDTTRDQLQGLVEDALTEGWTPGELSEAIDDAFSFGEVRAGLIARTELATAHTMGRVGSAEKAGAKGKRWLLSADHDDAENCSCSEAAEAGVVSFDESFVEGDPDYDFPPGHPNCWCDWVGEYPEGDEEDDEEGGDDGSEEEA